MPSETPYRSTLRPEDFAPQAGFRVSIVSIIVYLAGVAVHVFMYGGLDRIKHGGAVAGLAIGGYVAVFLLAMLISFFAFAGTRSRIVSALFFCLSVPALIFGDMKVNTLADAKLQPAATPTPAPVAVAATPAVPASAADPAISGNPTYGSAKRQQYIDQANNLFVPLRHAKIDAFMTAFNTLKAAGGVSPAGLTSKQAIADRRKLVAALNTANEEYMAFLTGQEETYRADLAQTPLVLNDVNLTAIQFSEKNAHTAERLAVRRTEKDLLKANDDVLEALDAKWGRWKLKGGHVAFDKKSDAEQFDKLLEKFNNAALAQAAAQKALVQLLGSGPADAGPDSAAPAAPVAPSPAAGAASPAASLATPGASAAPVVTPAGTPASVAQPTP